VVQRVLDRKEPTPRVPEQDEVATVQLERLTWSTSLTNRARSHSEGSSGRSLRNDPS